MIKKIADYITGNDIEQSFQKKMALLNEIKSEREQMRSEIKRLKELLRECGELLDKAENIIDRHSYDDFAKVPFKAAADRIKKEFGEPSPTPPHGKDER